PCKADAGREIRFGRGIDSRVARRCKSHAAIHLELSGRDLRKRIGGIGGDGFGGDRGRGGGGKGGCGAIVEFRGRRRGCPSVPEVQSEISPDAEVVLQEGREVVVLVLAKRIQVVLTACR